MTLPHHDRLILARGNLIEAARDYHGAWKHASDHARIEDQHEASPEWRALTNAARAYAESVARRGGAR